MPAYPSRVFASCPTLLLKLFFWLKSASTGLRACWQLLTFLAGSVASLSIGVVGNCLIGLLIGFALQPAPVVPTLEGAPEPVICGCGPCICEEPSASQSQWSETESEGGRPPLQPFCGVRHRCVYVRDSLLYSTSLERFSQLSNSSDRCQKASGSFVSL